MFSLLAVESNHGFHYTGIANTLSIVCTISGFTLLYVAEQQVDVSLEDVFGCI